EYTSFSAAAAEAGRSRVFGGIHYEFSNQAGQALGRSVADQVMRSFQVRADVVPPRLVVNEGKDVVYRAAPTFTGTVLDNLSGVSTLSYRVDAGAFLPLAFNSAGGFSQNVPLAVNGSSDGAHTVEFKAVDAAGNISTLVQSFSLDTIVPTITIVAPAALATLQEGAVLRGTASGTGSSLVSLRYAFNDAPLTTLPVVADPDAPNFGAEYSQPLDLGALTVGQHTLRVVAVDAAGNQNTSSISVTLAAPPALRLEKVWPADGAAELGVTIRPRIDFTRAVDPASLVSQSLFVSDAAGNRLPATIVPSADNTFAWLFLRDAMPGGTRMTINVDGSLIRAVDGQRLDADNNGAPGGLFTSTFTTVSRTILPNTSLVGVLADPGPDLKPGTPDDVAAGPDGVLMTADDVYKLPIAGARVYIIGLEDQVVVTGADGRFQFNAVPTGNVKLVLDGLTATNEPEGVYFPEMVVDLRIDPGAVNTVMAAMEPDPARAAAKTEPGAYLPRLATSLLQNVDAASGAMIGVNPESAPQLTPEQQQLLRIEILPGRMVGTNGQTVTGGQIGISTVPPELVRDMLPPGVLEHTFDITVQAPGIANFTVPAPMTFPNVFNAAPGTQLNFLSFDHTTGRLVIEGTATVSADGLSVTTDPGSGITHPGWHGVTPPGGDNKNPPREPKDPCREPLIDTIFNLVSLAKEIPRLAVPLAAGLAAGTAGAALGPGGAIAGFNLGFVLAESVAGKVDVVADGIEDSFETLVRGQLAGKTPAQIVSDVGGDWADVATQKAASAINPYLGYGESWRQAINEASDLGENLAKLTLCGNGGSGEGPSEGEFDNSNAALEAAYRGLASHFGWAPPTSAQLAEFVAMYRLNAAKGNSLPNSLKLVWEAGKAAAQVTDVLALANPTSTDIDRLKAALNTLRGYRTAVRNYDAEVQTDLTAVRAQADSLTLANSTPSAPEPTYFVYESSRGVVRGYAADGNVGAFLGSSLDVTVTLFQPRHMRLGQANFRSAASGGTGGAPVLMRESRAFDADSDGLPDDVEFVVGTRVDLGDTDGDGFSDLRELQLGLDPTGGRGLPNGVIAGVDLLGEAREAVLIQSPTDPTRTLALVATGSYGLDVVDTTQLLAPTSIGRINLPDDIGDVAYDPALRVAVATGGASQLFFVNLAEPTDPQLRTTLTLPESGVRRVEIRDGLAYATGYSKLYVIDIASATLVRTVETNAYDIVDIAIDGDLLVLLESRPRLYSYKLDNGDPVFGDQFDMIGSVGKLFVGGGIAYVTAGEGFAGGFFTVSVIDHMDLQWISDPDNTGLMGRAIAVGGSGLAVLVGNNGNQGFNADIVNVSDPTNTGANLTRFAIPGLPRGVAIGSGIAFVSASDRGLQVLNFAGADTAGVAPTVTLSSSAVDRDPDAAGRQIQEGSSVDVAASVVDDVQVEFVEWLVDGVSVGRDLSYPFTFRFAAPTLAGGATSTSVRGRAVDIGGNSTLSAPLTFLLVPDTFAPTVTLTSPVEGAKRRNLPAITVRFDEDLDPARLIVSRVQVIGKGPDKAFGTADDVRVNNLDLSGSNGRILAIGFVSDLPPDDYRLIVDAASIADRAGNVAANPFTMEFTKRPSEIPVAFGELIEEPLLADDGDLVFSFQATAGQRFMLDGIALDSPMYDNVQLLSPSGDLLESRYSMFGCYYYDCRGNVGGLLHQVVEPGTYTLRFLARQDTSVSFRLLNVADQPKIGLDTAAGGGAQVVPASALLALTGSYFDVNLRGVNELDWRETRTVAGTRADAKIEFNAPTWGTRGDVGLTNGSDANWEYFSVQWDGVLRVSTPNTYLFLDSDDGSRLWIDRDLDGQFESTELFAGNWNGGCCGITGSTDPLAPGDYPIRVQYEEGYGENRVALRWNQGSPLAPATSTAIYRFDGQAGQTVFLDTLFKYAQNGNVSYQVYAPAGNMLFNNTDYYGEQGRFVLPSTGEYVVRVSGEIYYYTPITADPYFYEFRLVTPQDTTTDMTLGTPVAGAISEPGKFDFYTFQVTAGDLLFFDSRGFNNQTPLGVGLRAELTGPGGFRAWDSSNIGADGTIFDLDQSGTYSLRIYGESDRTGGYDFSLQKLSVLPATPLDTLIGEGQSLDTQRTTRLYRFSATAGQRIFFDTATEPAYGFWLLLDVHGKALFHNYISNDAQRELPYTGDYLLALENLSATSPVPFSFRLVTSDILTTSIELGQTVTATLAEPGEIRNYTFNASQGDVLYLDRGREGVRITVVDSQGTTIVNQPYGWDLPPFAVMNTGIHTISVESNGLGDTPAFSFRLLRLADQPAKNLGDSLSETLDPGRKSLVFRYYLTAGQPVYFDGVGDCSFGGQVTLYSPAFQGIGGVCIGSDFAATPTVTGEYWLALAGDSNSPVTVTGELRAAARSEQTLPAFNSLVSGNLAQAGDKTTYTFSVDAGETIRYSYRGDGGNVSVLIRGPLGDQLWSGGANGESPFLLPSRSGTYRLELLAWAANAAFQFELSRFSTSATILPGVAFGGTLAAGRDVQVYQLTTGVLGQRLNVVAVSADSADGYWGFYTQSGQMLASGGLNSNPSGIVLPGEGPYWFIVQTGNNVPQANAYQFRIDDVSDASGSMTGWNSVIEGSIADGDSIDIPLTGIAGRPFYFDALDVDYDGVVVTLIAPGGTSVHIVNHSASYDAGPFTLPQTGAYTLRVQGVNGGGDYKFRLLDVAAAPLVAAGESFSGGDLAAYATRVYRVNLAASDRYLLDNRANSTIETVLFSSTLVYIQNDYVYSSLPLALQPSIGNAFYLFLRNIYDTPLANNLALVSLNDQPVLSFNTRVDAAINPARHADFYRFAAAANETIYIAGIGNF
ncbi:MAG: Ig-like domain-containing protein, partial [Planctomycetota bacterium]